MCVLYYDVTVFICLTIVCIYIYICHVQCVCVIVVCVCVCVQCTKTCGSGLKVREVKCYQGDEVGLSCDSALKPAARQSCEIQPCPTEAPGNTHTHTLFDSWALMLVSQSIPELLCEVRCVCVCVVVEDECEDKVTANCALVLKVKLCTHWYYRKACCSSCRGR